MITYRSEIYYYVILPLVCASLLGARGPRAAAEEFFERRDHSDQDRYEKRTVAILVHTEYQAETWLHKYGYLSDCRPDARRRKREAIPQPNLLPKIVEEGINLGDTAGTSLRSNIIPDCTQAEVTKAMLKYQKMYNLPQTGELDLETKRHMNSRRCGNKDTGDDTAQPTSTAPTTQALGAESATTAPLSRPKRALRYVIREGKARSSHELNNAPGMEETTMSRRSHTKRTFSQIMSDSRKWRSKRRKRSTVLNANHTQSQMFSKDVVTYRILESGYSLKLSVDKQWEILDLAFRMWSEVIPIKFEAQPHGDVRMVDIKIAFGTGSHQNCYHNFDGAGGEIAHAWFVGDFHLDDEEDYRESDPEGINLLKVAVHEIGHVLGLNHSDRAYSIMFGIYDMMMMGKEFELGWEDRKEIQKIYGTCKGRFDTVIDWVRVDVDGKRVFNTYFFRQNRYWMYENKQNRTRYGDPQIVTSQWKGVPANLDAYVHLLYWSMVRHEIVDIQYFFKGANVYLFDPQKNEVVRGWPKKIADVFPGVPNNLNTAYFDSRDNNLYFFKDDRVYVHNPQASRCCVRNSTISAEFPTAKGHRALPTSIDSAYYSYRDDKLYFLKNEFVWWNVRYSRIGRAGDNLIQFLANWSQRWYDICEVNPSTL